MWIGGHWFTVVGILNPVQLVSQMDSMAFIGFPIAEQYFGFDGHPTGLYLRSVPSQVNAVADVLPATVSPANPSVVAVSFPSDILKAELVTKGAYNGLLLGLGAVALLVGGVGIANVMVISVLERRSEIGLRRALGASRRHVAEQFLAEAVMLVGPRRRGRHRHRRGRDRHLRARASTGRCRSPPRPLRRRSRRSGHRRHRRPVPIDSSRPPLADRGLANGMSACSYGHKPPRRRQKGLSESRRPLSMFPLAVGRVIATPSLRGGRDRRQPCRRASWVGGDTDRSRRTLAGARCVAIPESRSTPSRTSRETRAATDALGLKGGWMSYFGCRAAPLGAVSAPVVGALFYNFHPQMVARAMPDAWTHAEPVTLLEARLSAIDGVMRVVVTKLHSFTLRELHYPYRAPRERRETVRVRPEGPPISSTFSSTATPSRVTPSDASARAAGPSSWSRRPSSK